MESPRKRYLYRVQPKDPNKRYIDIKHVKVIIILMIVAVALSAILSIIPYAK